MTDRQFAEWCNLSLKELDSNMEKYDRELTSSIIKFESEKARLKAEEAKLKYEMQKLDSKFSAMCSELGI